VSAEAAGSLGLECVAGGQHLAIAADSVAQIVEYDVAPLPHASRWVAGLGVLGEKVIVSVALAGPAAAAPKDGRRNTKGVLLNVPSSTIAWALEVSEVSSFVRAEVSPIPTPPRPGASLAQGGHDLPAWVGRAKTGDGRSIGWVNAEDLVRAVSMDAGGPE
jgi:chemotaxis signal transduction protein